MVSESASVNFPLPHKVQNFSSGTGSPGWSRKKGHKAVVVVVVWFIIFFETFQRNKEVWSEWQISSIETRQVLGQWKQFSIIRVEPYQLDVSAVRVMRKAHTVDVCAEFECHVYICLFGVCVCAANRSAHPAGACSDIRAILVGKYRVDVPSFVLSSRRSFPSLAVRRGKSPSSSSSSLWLPTQWYEPYSAVSLQMCVMQWSQSTSHRNSVVVWTKNRTWPIE